MTERTAKRKFGITEGKEEKDDEEKGDDDLSSSVGSPAGRRVKKARAQKPPVPNEHMEACYMQYRGQITKINAMYKKDLMDKDLPFHQRAWVISEYVRLAGASRYLYRPVCCDLLVCGSNDCFQIGSRGKKGEYDEDKNPLNSANRPRLVRNVRNVAHVAAGSIFTAVVTVEGKVYTWGSCDDGVLGRRISLGNAEDEQLFPAQVVNLIPSRECSFKIPTSREDGAIVAAAAGGSQLLMLSRHGSVYMTGTYKTSEGKYWRDLPPPDLPDSDIPQKPVDPAPRGYRDQPCHVWQLDQPARAIACGASMNAAILADFSLVTWGWDNRGELGRNIKKKERDDVLRRVNRPGGEGYDEVVDKNLIQERFLKPLPPIWAGMPSAKMDVLSVACGEAHLVVAAREIGIPVSNAYTSGLNNYGQLGLGASELGCDRSELTKVPSSEGKNITQVAAGQHHSLFLDHVGYCIYACGRGDSGQLGLTDSIPKPDYHESTLQRVLFDKPGIYFTSIAAGDFHSLAISAYGDAYSWGFGDMGALGHGRDRDEYRPRRIERFSGNIKGKALECSAGAQHSCVLIGPDVDADAD